MAALYRDNLRVLAKIRLREARQLLSAGMWDGAYYLAGYAVECGLKACIARGRRRFEFPDRQLAIESYTHNVDQLARVAGLQDSLGAERAKSIPFEDNWLVVRTWNESSRYSRYTERAARGMVSAVAHPRTGVMGWIRRHW